jgi:hypothetical protein
MHTLVHHICRLGERLLQGGFINVTNRRYTKIRILHEKQMHETDHSNEYRPTLKRHGTRTRSLLPIFSPPSENSEPIANWDQVSPIFFSG